MGRLTDTVAPAGPKADAALRGSWVIGLLAALVAIGLVLQVGRGTTNR